MQHFGSMYILCKYQSKCSCNCNVTKR